MVKTFCIGSIVRIKAPGSRESEGEERDIPAVVIGQWSNGDLQLYALHFQGSPVLINAIPVERVEVVWENSLFEGLVRRVAELERKLAAFNPEPKSDYRSHGAH
jgi:hypothetical protein